MYYLLFVSLLWSFSFAIIKGALTTLDANFVAVVRLMLSMAVFLPFLRFRGLTRVRIVRLLTLGAIQFGVMYSCYTASFSYLPAYMIALLTTTTPLLVVFFDMIVTRRNVPTFWIAALLVVVGTALLGRQSVSLTFDWKGVLLLQLSNAAFAFGQIGYRRMAREARDWDDKACFAVIYAGGAAVCGVASLFTVDFATLVVSSLQWQMLVYLGVVASGLCFFLWNRGATCVGAGTLGLMNNLKIPLGVIVSILVLNEPFNLGILLFCFMLFMLALWLCRRVESAM